MSDDRKWSRVYYNDLQRDYPDLWHDDSTLATYVRLLSLAEATWPTRPEVPRSAADGAVLALTRAGLVISLPRDTYAIKGLDAERNARSIAGRNAAVQRWQSERNAAGNAAGNANAMPNRDETSRDEPSSPLPLTRGRRTNGTNPRATGENPRAQGTSIRQEREAQKRGPSALHEILSSIQTKGKA